MITIKYFAHDWAKGPVPGHPLSVEIGRSIDVSRLIQAVNLTAKVVPELFAATN